MSLERLGLDTSYTFIDSRKCASEVGETDYNKEKRRHGNTRTEYDALHTTVIRCCDSAETFLACGDLQYRTKQSAKGISASVPSLASKRWRAEGEYTTGVREGEKGQ